LKIKCIDNHLDTGTFIGYMQSTNTVYNKKKTKKRHKYLGDTSHIRTYTDK